MKTTTARETPIEDFGSGHWRTLLSLEEFVVTGRQTYDGREHDAEYHDLITSGFVQETTPQGMPAITTLTERGWEVAGMLRRWVAEKRELSDFLSVACGHCSRIRYGERRACVCGSEK